MNAKRWIALLLIAVLMLTGLFGCKSPATDEEGAVAGEYVEGEANDQPEGEQDLPQKVEGSNGSDKVVVPSVDDEEEEKPEEPVEEPEDPAEEPEEPVEETPVEDQVDADVTYDPRNKIKILDYNVRCANDGPNKQIAERAPRLDLVVTGKDPDIMGFQEVTPTWLDYLDTFFSEQYDYVYQYRDDSTNSECTPIFWKKDKFKKMDEGYFWLSDTPKVSSKGWGADHYRVCSWVRLKVIETGAEFLYFNTHYDYKTQEIHVKSSNLMLKMMRQEKAFSKYPVFLTGDFNMNPWKDGFNALVTSGDLSDINEDLGRNNTPTTNGYNEDESGSIIDFCFYSPAKAVPLHYEVLNEKILDGYVSDHRGIYAEAALIA